MPAEWLSLLTNIKGVFDTALGVKKTVDGVYEAIPKAAQAEAAAPPVRDPAILADRRDVVGRAKELSRLKQEFDGLKDFPAIAIHGPGGCGKSTLAEKYAEAQLSALNREGVWRMAATSDADAAESLKPLAAKLGVEATNDAATIISQTLDAIAKDGRRWLLIHDNVDEREQFNALGPRLAHADRIQHLVTGRWSEWSKIAKPFPLDMLGRFHAGLMLANESGLENDDELQAFAHEDLGGLPLALVVAGADLRRPEMSLATYRPLFATRLKTAPEGRRYDKSVYAAVAGSVDRLGADAQALLKLAAFMAAEDISFGQGPGDAREAGCFLTDGAQHIAERNDPAEYAPLRPPFDGLATEALRLGDAVREAETHSLLRPAEWEGRPTRRIHRLTQTALRGWMGEEEAAWCAGLVGRLGMAQFTSNPQYAVGDWRRYARLAPHARSLAATGARAEGVDARRAANFVNNVALYLNHAAGDLPLARQLYADNLPAQEAAYSAGGR